MIALPASRIWPGSTPLIAALVPQKMKFGVSIAPCGVVNRPVRAPLSGSRWSISNRKFS